MESNRSARIELPQFFLVFLDLLIILPEKYDTRCQQGFHPDCCMVPFSPKKPTRESERPPPGLSRVWRRIRGSRGYGLLQHPRSSVRQRLKLSLRYHPCRAASAASARSRRMAKNAGDWPMNSPSAVKALSAPIAAPCVSVGRMIETAGNVRLRKTVGSGMIRLVWKSCPPKGGALRSGNTNPLVGSLRAGALPALSCQV